MIILDGIPGRITMLRTNPAAGLIRFINIKPILSFDTHRVLITRVGVSKSCNYQLLHSLGSVVYVYVFGDRVGSVVISGLAVGGPVSYGARCTFESGTGMDLAMAYFDQNRIANSQNENREIEVVIGKTPIRGFLTDMQLNILNPEFQLAEFQMVIRTIPEVLPQSGQADGGPLGNPGNGWKRGRDIADAGF